MVPEPSSLVENGFGAEIHWVAGVVGGLLAGAVFGVLIQFALGAMPAVGAVYGTPGVYAGWIVHLVHSAVFGLLYAVVVQHDPIEEYGRNLLPGAVLGIAYGMMIWACFFVFVRPLWLNLFGLTDPASITYLQPLPLAGHIVFGALLGGLYALTVGTDRLSHASSTGSTEQ